MELSILLLKKIITLISIIAMGFVLVKQGKVKSEDSSVLSRLCFDWVVPCNILYSFMSNNDGMLLQSFGFSCVATLTAVLLFIGLTFLLRKPLGLNPSEQGSLMFSNSASMALPLAAALLGSESVIYCAPHMGIQNLFIFTLIPAIMSREAVQDKKKIFLNRNILAILAGLLIFLFHIEVPEILADVISTVGGVIGPMCMFMIGMIMGGVDFRKLAKKKKIYLVCLIRLIVYPLIAILLIAVTGITKRFPYAEQALIVLVMCISSPAASLITQMSDLYRSREEAGDAGSINVITTLLCSITMPLMIFIFQWI